MGGFGQARTWTNDSGNQIEAEMRGMEGDVVLLQKDGQVFRVPLASLSEEDQAFAKAWKPSPAETSGVPAGEVPKKGFCIAGRDDPKWPERLLSLKPGWYYQWKSQKSSDASAGVQFVPMVFGKPDRIDGDVAYVTANKDAEGFQFLLGYNEPDKVDQANMTVEDALKAWPKLMGTGLPLVSPAAANAEGEWMEQFMEGVEKLGYRVDYIGLHWYSNPNPNNLLDKVERLYKKFDRPIWITEFAVADWDAKDISENRHSARTIKDFMKQVLPKLDRSKYVYRYAWFSASPSDAHLGSSALFNDDGTLTELGEVYAEHD